MTIDIMYISRARVEQQDYTVVDGQPTVTWAQATDPDPDLTRRLKYLPCRLDLTFLRPGKDVVAPVNAGRAPDRIGVLFCAPTTPIRAGQRIVMIPSPNGTTPVQGTFEIRQIPDLALGMAGAHHLEVQVIETNQELAGRWPDDVPGGD